MSQKYHPLVYNVSCFCNNLLIIQFMKINAHANPKLWNYLLIMSLYQQLYCLVIVLIISAYLMMSLFLG